jgi:hypothetical protein
MLVLQLTGCLLLVALQDDKQGLHPANQTVDDLHAVELALDIGGALCATFTDGSLWCSYGPPADPGPLHSLSADAGFCGVQDDESLSCWGGVDTPPNGHYSEVAAPGPCALTTRGEVVCWGMGEDGDVPSGSDFTTIAAHTSAGCAARDGADAVCWDIVYTDLTRDVPTGTFVDLTVNYDGACGVRSGGRLLCWGKRYDPIYPPSGTYAMVASSSFTFAALDTDGFAEFWGDDVTTLRANTPARPWKTITISDGIACAINEDDGIECWGDQPPDPSEMERAE